jgi:hypothetical protein
MELKEKVKIFFKYLLLILFIGYYASITLFYHSHTINSKTIYHSHPYFPLTDADGLPINHSHTENELVFIKSLTLFIYTFIPAFLLVKLIISGSFRSPVNESVFSPLVQAGYSLRGPPVILPNLMR